jgi:hypothetical protein
MTGSGNQAGARVPRPQGTLPNQGNVQVHGSGTAVLATANGPFQMALHNQAVEAYLQPFLTVTHFLGIPVTVHKEVARLLALVEDALDYAKNQQKHGVSTLRGKQPQGHWLHSYGCAIDFNYETSPYLMHEAGESALDATLTDVYNRIALFILGRPSVIPLDILAYNTSQAHRETMYKSLYEESGAMQRYFGLFMREPGTFLNPYLNTQQGKDNAQKTSWDGVPPQTVPGTTAALQQIQKDWVTLSGRSNGPQILLLSSPGGSYSQWQNPCDLGMCYPQATQYPVESGHKTAPDAPFVSKAGVTRDPASGFMTFDLEIVNKLCDHGFTWGAIGLGKESGDVMHFELTAFGKQVIADADRAVSGRA